MQTFTTSMMVNFYYIHPPCFLEMLTLLLETTVITLADWYHTVAPTLFPNTGDVDP